MDRDPGDFPRLPPRPVNEMSPDEFDAWMATMPPAPGIRHIDDDDPDEDARAMADVEAGRGYPHEVVGQWLKTWGDPGYKPFKEWLAAQDG